tara:strand:+ start:1392 stop:1997 length:606 start_codon:yes stop_codon:yes gene_type:complete
MYTSQGPSIDRAFDQGFKIAAERYGVVLLNFIILAIMLLISMVTIIGLILWPAFIGGFYGSLVRIGRGDPAQIGDFFKIGFDKFGPLLGAMILYFLGIVVGLMFLLIPGIYLMVTWFFVPYLIVDKNLPVTEAFSESMNLIHKKVGWWKTFGLFCIMLLISIGLEIIGFIPFIGIVISILGTIFLAPFLYMVYAIYYIDSV